MFDVSPDHAIGLLAGLVAAPVALVVLPRQPGWTKVAGTVRGAAVLLLVTGAIHLALIPPHLQTEPLTSSLFAVNGVLFLALALRVSWRRRSSGAPRTSSTAPRRPRSPPTRIGGRRGPTATGRAARR